MVRVDPDYNIWTTDIGSHVVLKLSPEGRVTARRWGEYGFREIVYLHLPNFYDVVCERPGTSLNQCGTPFGTTMTSPSAISR